MYQVFSCSCPAIATGERVGRQTFRDQDKTDFDKRCLGKGKYEEELGEIQIEGLNYA
jgi:hypothetical protein